jgi:EpsI family protein
MSDDTAPESPRRLHFSRRHIVTGVVLGAASLTAQARQPKANMSPIPTKTFGTWIPRKFGEWKSGDGNGIVLPPPDVLSDRQYDDLASLSYKKADEESVMVCIAYNYEQDGVVQIHRPEVCYPSGGFAITQPTPITVDAGGRDVPALFFTATSAERTEQVLYWTRLGSRFPRQWVDQRWAIALSNIWGVIPDGVLARFSLIGTDAADAQQRLKAFVDEFTAASNKQLKQVLFGTV